MSKARDIANILSANTAIATDAEVTAAVSTAVTNHNSLTTSVHGIADTSSLATQTYVQNNKGINKGNTASRPSSPANGDLYYNTETSILEVYDAGWWIPNVVPGAPTSVSAINQGSGRAYNNGQSSVSFTPATLGGKATSYTVTSTPGSYTSSGSSSPLTVTGLQSSVQYTYSVTANGPLGPSANSSPSVGVTSTTVPQAPSISSVTAGNAQVSVAFSANSTGGSAITSYTVTSSPGNVTASGSSSPILVSGLTNGTAYTFTVIATNSNGDSQPSSASSAATPIAGIAAEYLVLAGGGGAGTDYAGGGGAGGYRTNYGEAPVYLSPGSTYTITVGGGGYAGNRGNGSNGGPGANSSISLAGSPIIESTGGGYGAQYWSTGGNGGSGGGGGGAYGGEVYNNGGSGNTPATTPSQGNNGGKGYGPNGYGSNRYGGGGGSPVAAGTDSTSSSPGVGAAGISNSISGSAITYARGGDGCTSQGAGPTRGTTSNRGEGGSGGGENIQGTPGSSGIVVIKAPVQASSTTGSPSNPSTGVYIFSGNGSITF